VPLGAVPVLSWCGEVSLGGKHPSSFTDLRAMPRLFKEVVVICGRAWMSGVAWVASEAETSIITRA